MLVSYTSNNPFPILRETILSKTILSMTVFPKTTAFRNRSRKHLGEITEAHRAFGIPGDGPSRQAVGWTTGPAPPTPPTSPPGTAGCGTPGPPATSPPHEQGGTGRASGKARQGPSDENMQTWRRRRRRSRRDTPMGGHHERVHVHNTRVQGHKLGPAGRPCPGAASPVY